MGLVNHLDLEFWGSDDDLGFWECDGSRWMFVVFVGCGLDGCGSGWLWVGE